jgi:probable HAF family extracellular repeat protein
VSCLVRWGWTIAAIALLSTSVEASSISYTITDLGTLPGTSLSIATGINDSGQIVGYANNATGSQSFLYSNGQMTPISDPVSGVPAGGINNAGQIVSQGEYINNSGQVVSQPFQIPVTTTVGGVTTTTMTTFMPAGINDAGQILGIIQNIGSTTYPQDVGIYQNGKFFDITKALGLAHDSTYAMAINNAGSVLLGDYNAASGNTFVVLYNPNGTSQILPLESGKLPAMNDLGQIIGMNQLGNVLYSNGTYTPLLSLLPPSSQSLWQGLNPMAINDEGQIVGEGVTSNGQIHAFLMTPTATPEPSTLALLATAIGYVSIRRWVRRNR